MLRLDFISDINCPWCALGLTALDQALARLGSEVPVSLQFQPFELNPQLPVEGVALRDYLQQKYGMGAAQFDKVHEDMRLRGEALGFRFGPRERMWNSFNAHRLLAWAAAEGPAGAQHRLKRALVRAYMGEGRNINDASVLEDAAITAGLDPLRARQVIESDAFAQDVRARQAEWHRAGIQAVPSLVIDRQHLVQGAQSVETYEEILRDLASRLTSATGSQDRV